MDAVPLETFKRNLAISFVFHICVLVLFTVKAYLFPVQPLVLQEAIRVDMVGLPEKTLPDAVAISEPISQKAASSPAKEPEPLAPPEPTPKAAPNLAATRPRVSQKDQQIEALTRLKALEEIERGESSRQRDANREAERKVDQAIAAIAGRRPLKGNVVSEGTARTGVEKIVYDQYLLQLRAHISKFWTLPEWVGAARLSAELVVRIDERGYVIHRQLLKASGDSTFDTLVQDTIERASPFPQPPDKFVSLYANEGIVLSFP